MSGGQVNFFQSLIECWWFFGLAQITEIRETEIALCDKEDTLGDNPVSFLMAERARMHTHLPVLLEDIPEKCPQVATFVVLLMEDVFPLEVVRIKICPRPNVPSFSLTSQEDSRVGRYEIRAVFRLPQAFVLLAVHIDLFLIVTLEVHSEGTKMSKSTNFTYPCM
jgi:hypothetical protein